MVLCSNAIARHAPSLTATMCHTAYRLLLPPLLSLVFLLELSVVKRLSMYQNCPHVFSVCACAVCCIILLHTCTTGSNDGVCVCYDVCSTTPSTTITTLLMLLLSQHTLCNSKTNTNQYFTSICVPTCCCHYCCCHCCCWRCCLHCQQ
jgi:hypothetical protein